MLISLGLPQNMTHLQIKSRQSTTGYSKPRIFHRKQFIDINKTLAVAHQMFVANISSPLKKKSLCQYQMCEFLNIFSHPREEEKNNQFRASRLKIEE